VTDVFPAFALATGEGENDVLRRAPRDPREPLLAWPQWTFIGVYGALLTASTLGVLIVGHYEFELHGEALVTLTFLTLAFGQLVHVFNMREPDSPILRNAVSLNPYVWLAVLFCSGLLLGAVYLPPLASALRIAPPDLDGWLLVAAASVLPLFLGVMFSAAGKLARGSRR
jgi:Ca2+-transporting ATPase